MQIFTSKYKCNVSKIKSIDSDIVLTTGDYLLLRENTPFMIFSINGCGVDLISLDRKYMVSMNAEVLKIGFSESECMFGEAIKESK